jgi:hypothetical protein
MVSRLVSIVGRHLAGSSSISVLARQFEQQHSCSKRFDAGAAIHGPLIPKVCTTTLEFMAASFRRVIGKRFKARLEWIKKMPGATRAFAVQKS